MGLFKNAAAFTDIHLGLKHNSKIHNEDCVKYVEWFCDQANKRGCETAFFLGDWHHHRNTINVSTLNYTHRCLRILNDNFDQIFMLAGNHDLYYREKRDTHSLPMTELYPNIKLIDDVVVTDEVAMIPWLMTDEWKEVTKLKCKYMFGHFELPGFKLNAMVEMPDTGGLNRTHFKKPDYVFTGHFHKRQFGQNVHYIGNPFAHGYADAWDFDRGAMFLKWDGKPEYVNWEDGPIYLTTSVSELVASPETYLIPNAHIKAVTDIELSYEEITALKDQFVEEYKIRELILVPPLRTDHEEGTVDVGSFETIDEIIVGQLKELDTKDYKINNLIDIYNNL